MSQSPCIIDVEKAEYENLLWGSDNCALFTPVCETRILNITLLMGGKVGRRFEESTGAKD